MNLRVKLSWNVEINTFIKIGIYYYIFTNSKVVFSGNANEMQLHISATYNLCRGDYRVPHKLQATLPNLTHGRLNNPTL